MKLMQEKSLRFLRKLKPGPVNGPLAIENRVHVGGIAHRRLLGAVIHTLLTIVSSQQGVRLWASSLSPMFRAVLADLAGVGPRHSRHTWAAPPPVWGRQTHGW
ncbi:hypothetical protein K458DRAFT_415641 [Lentithecium fluviatile CBS 122367]|uniref:Uncharacterized protein n=1 Tax=Lentithecium fluviatile CBS 122367 TaxID=1168545 RepID=A0A6G1JB72_9PLEO|nr:hypothetical protein K458DRAFT_415641 [Lentithecium fluviatile CBS 122367]